MKNWMIVAAALGGLIVARAVAGDDNGKWVRSAADTQQFQCRGFLEADGETPYSDYGSYGPTFKCTDGSVVFTGAVTVPDSTVTTGKIAVAAVSTAKLYLDLPAVYVPCITTAKRLGYCTALDATTGVCNACH